MTLDQMVSGSKFMIPSLRGEKSSSESTGAERRPKRTNIDAAHLTKDAGQNDDDDEDDAEDEARRQHMPGAAIMEKETETERETERERERE